MVGTISNSVIYDLNTFYWATRKPILAGARFATSATVALANNSLTTETNGAVSGGGGYADSYIQPVILGWEKPRVRIKAVYALLAPTGRFTAGARTNATANRLVRRRRSRGWSGGFLDEAPRPVEDRRLDGKQVQHGIVHVGLTIFATPHDRDRH